MEKPILFNTEMVKAVLEDSKTQTRRIIKPQPTHKQFGGFIYAAGDKRDIGKAMFVDKFPAIGKATADHIKPPCKKGDILWVRETWRYGSGRGTSAYQYKADMAEKELQDEGILLKWHPSIHMPKEAARIFLKVVNIKVERLEDISEKDALNEGVKVCSSGGYVLPGSQYDRIGLCHSSAEMAFRIGFREIYPKIEQENPWLWVIEFERIDRP